MHQTELDLEMELQQKELSAPRLSPWDIDRVISSETYAVLPSGKTMICELILRNGFFVRGDASVVSIENFDHEIGRKISKNKARDQIWQLEAYLLQEKLHNS